MKNYRKNGQLYLAIAFGMMVVLFVSSSMTYQQQSQVSVIDHWLKNQPWKDFFSMIDFHYGGTEISVSALGYGKFVEFFLRKGAHFGTYFVLGGSLYLGLLPNLKKNLRVLPMIFAWLAATGYAATDEFHQMLTGGRTPLFQDVMLDSAGALTACVLVLLVSYWKKS